MIALYPWEEHRTVTIEEIETKAIQAFEDRSATPSTAERQRAATYHAELVAEMERIFQIDPELPADIPIGKPA